MAVDEFRFRSMASDAQVLVVDGPPHFGHAARRALDQLEARWSRFVESSDISRLNRSAGRPVEVDPATLTLVDTMIEAWRVTDGRFDPTILPALLEAGYVASVEDPSAFSVRPSPPSVDSQQGHAAALEQTIVDRENRTVTLPAGTAIDPGGIGKGLAADLVVAEFLARGARGVLVSIGGDLAAGGEAPSGDGWTVDIEDHMDPSATMARLMFSGGGVATSSTRSRRWRVGGAARHHVIDPTKKRPSVTDLVAVTVFSTCGWLAEAHATELLLGGVETFAASSRRHRIEAIATTTTGRVLATEQLAPQIESAVAA